MENLPLAKLPAEIRNKIYALALIIEDDTFFPELVCEICETPLPEDDELGDIKDAGLSGRKWRGGVIESMGWKSPAFLRTCRLIRGEASSIYYGCNKFGVHFEYDDRIELDVELIVTLQEKGLVHWFRRLGAGNRKLIREVGALWPVVPFARIERRTEAWRAMKEQFGLDLVDASYCFLADTKEYMAGIDEVYA